MKLNKMLNELDSYPFHMPGHKRNSDFSIPSSSIDITEIDGFDNLHNPNGVLKELQERCSRIFGYDRSIISVNGSTCCVLAAILAVSNKGDDIIIARNCHKSVYNACFLNELNVHYIETEYDEEFGCYREVAQSAVDKALKQCPNACAIVITSPTYEGITSNIKADIPVIVDSAHGAHFGLADYLPERINADIVIQSLHKTLPCLTQIAVIHINNSDLFGRVKMYMDILETSSPSYVLLSSVDKCFDFLDNSKEKFTEYKALLDDFYSHIKNKNHIKLLKNDDITRIILGIDGYTGSELADILRSKYNIEVEGATLKYVILISTVCDTKEGFELLKKALAEIQPKPDTEIKLTQPPIPEKAYNSYVIDETIELNLYDAEGKICGEYIYTYPPGSPIIAPGEIISKEIVDYIKLSINNGLNILSDGNIMELKILTKA